MSDIAVMGACDRPAEGFPRYWNTRLSGVIVSVAEWSRSLIERSEIVTFENSAFDEVPEVQARE